MVGWARRAAMAVGLHEPGLDGYRAVLGLATGRPNNIGQE